MSNYTYNNNPLSSIFTPGESAAAGYTAGDTGVRFKALVSTDNPLVKHTSNVGFKSGGIDFVNTFLPYYREYYESPQDGLTEYIPSWCKKVHVIVVAGGGGAKIVETSENTYDNAGGGGGAAYGIFDVDGGRFYLQVGRAGGDNRYDNRDDAGTGGDTMLYYTQTTPSRNYSVKIGIRGGKGGNSRVGGLGGSGYDDNQIFGIDNYKNYSGQNADSGTYGVNGFNTDVNATNDNIKTLNVGQGSSKTTNGVGGYIRTYFCID